MGDIRSDDICLPKSLMYDEALHSWRWLNICPTTESEESILCFVLLVWEAVVLPIKLPLSQTRKFSSFYPSDSLPDPTGGGISKWLPGVKSQHLSEKNTQKEEMSCIARTLQFGVIKSSLPPLVSLLLY